MRYTKMSTIALMAAILVTTALAGEAETMPQNHGNMLWTLVAAVLVFFMQAGFAMVETGFTRAKNAITIMMKNLMDFSIGSLGYWAIGFGLMFGVTSAGLFGHSGFFLSDAVPGKEDWEWTLVFFMFQTVFCATAATIVSGGMAERTKFSAYLINIGCHLPCFGTPGMGKSFPRRRMA